MPEIAKYNSLSNIVGDVSRETFEKLLIYEQELLKWQSHINLISSHSIKDIWERHILDSAQLSIYCAPYNRLLDIGSGGGFPALILAILRQNDSNFNITLVEKLKKKCNFLQYIISKFNLSAIVQNKKIEDIIDIYSDSEIITSRAFAELSHIINLCEPAFNKGGKALLQKGQNAEYEIDKLANNWTFKLKKYISYIDTSSVILEISNVKRKPVANK